MNTYTEGFSLQRFTPEQWPVFKAIRLEALKEEPAVFSSNYAKEAAFPDTEWASRLRNLDAAFWGLYYNNTCIGITGIIRRPEHKDTATCIASYIRSNYRGQGLSALFYEARIAWAKAQGCKSIEVSHRSSNTSSHAANKKAGFVYTHSERAAWPDGTEEAIDYYKRDL